MAEGKQFVNNERNNCSITVNAFTVAQRREVVRGVNTVAIADVIIS
jgi:hypothetical protein